MIHSHKTCTSRAIGAVVAALALTLAACGGGGGSSSDTRSTTTTPPTVSAASVSTGTISAFGSVFVNGHEFDTSHARVIDDDTGSASTDLGALEVGMAVDVKRALSSTPDKPVAAEIHVRPLVRGIVDASDSGAGTLLVLGQSVQLTAATNYSDHRACLTATTAPCSAVAGQSDLVAATGSGSSATPGSYVTAYGYLYSTSATSGTADIVATLVSVRDAPSTTTGVNYKVEGLVNAVGTNNVTIGGLLVDLTNASCSAGASKATCASAFSVGQIVAAYGGVAPSLPATTLAASVARQRAKLAVETTGADIEVEGKVSSVTTTPAALVIRGVAIDASAITGALPADGDEVRVIGTVGTGGTTVAATSITVLHAAANATYGLEGDVESVAAGTGADSVVVSVLGQSVSVNGVTRLADRSTRGSGGGASGSNPFNLTTFQTYLAASASKHVLVRTQADASGRLTALALTIVPASTAAAISGNVDASPAPVNSSAAGAPTTFSVHGLAISADPGSIVVQRRADHDMSSSKTVAAGDRVLARGTYAAGVLTVAARAGGSSPGGTALLDNIVIDSGVPVGRDHDCF